MYLDLAYFHQRLKDGLDFSKLEEMVLGIELSRHYLPSPDNEANYETFRVHLAQLAPEYPELTRLEERTRELLQKEHVEEASAETLVAYCLEQQGREELSLRRVYENTPFQLMRMGELSEKVAKEIFQQALATETCGRWFGMGAKLNELFSHEEIEASLQKVSDEEIRKGLLKSLVDRGLVQKALQIFNASSCFEKEVLFRILAGLPSKRGQVVSAAEECLWSEMLEKKPLEVFSRGATRIEREASRFLFLREPVRSYFFEHISAQTEEFLLDAKPVLPVGLLRILLALEEKFDLEIWRPAAQYGGYQIIDIDYQNGYKVGEGKGKHFPVSEFAVAQFHKRNLKLPRSIPNSIPIPYRDPRDR